MSIATQPLFSRWSGSSLCSNTTPAPILPSLPTLPLPAFWRRHLAEGNRSQLCGKQEEAGGHHGAGGHLGAILDSDLLTWVGQKSQPLLTLSKGLVFKLDGGSNTIIFNWCCFVLVFFFLLSYLHFYFMFQPFFWPFGVRRDLWQRRSKQTRGTVGCEVRSHHLIKPPNAACSHL